MIQHFDCWNLIHQLQQKINSSTSTAIKASTQNHQLQLQSKHLLKINHTLNRIQSKTQIRLNFYSKSIILKTVFRSKTIKRLNLYSNSKILNFDELDHVAAFILLLSSVAACAALVSDDFLSSGKSQASSDRREEFDTQVESCASRTTYTILRFRPKPARYTSYKQSPSDTSV